MSYSPAVVSFKLVVSIPFSHERTVGGGDITSPQSVREMVKLTIPSPYAANVQRKMGLDRKSRIATCNSTSLPARKSERNVLRRLHDAACTLPAKSSISVENPGSIPTRTVSHRFPNDVELNEAKYEPLSQSLMLAYVEVPEDISSNCIFTSSPPTSSWFLKRSRRCKLTRLKMPAWKSGGSDNSKSAAEAALGRMLMEYGLSPRCAPYIDTLSVNGEAKVLL
mmetsp:Transcript_95695/g.139789  ORF Transcript_95695/g.139789 Transcript_95695/m.139789 type:complete len:223 (-) Transcript_95695:407-1075(-)